MMRALLWIRCLQVAAAVAQRLGLIRHATEIGQAKLEAVRRVHGAAS